MAAPYQSLPATMSEWNRLMKVHNPKVDVHTPMNYMCMNSASKMKLYQFLMLRVLWNEASKLDEIWTLCKSKKLAESADQAKLFLQHFTAFQQYLTKIDKNTSLKADSDSTHQSVKTVGGRRVPNPIAKSNTFSLVLHQQRSCDTIMKRGSDEDELPSKVIVAPLPSSRPGTASSAGITAGMDALNIDPDTSSQDPPSQVPEQDFLDDIEAHSTRSIPSTTLTDRFARRGPLQLGDGADDFDVVEDEQIVNSALISFLQALTMHHPEVNGEWGYFRHPFTLRNGLDEKLYEARVDGLFRKSGFPNPQMIVEVKPYLRTASQILHDKIRIQEGAQMAAWIGAHPPTTNTARGHKYKRLLISQDRHEVYVTVATFDLLYVQYIQGLSTGLSFLEMNQHGPFEINNRDDMELLA